jgi:hypothetical protein
VIACDIVVDGTLAFGRGEPVTVELVSPNPSRPEYMYVVTSARSGTRFQLRDVDLVAPGPAVPAQPPQTPAHSAAPATQSPYQQQYRAAQVAAPVRPRSRVKLLLVVGVVAIVVVGAAATAFVLVKGSSRSNTAVKAGPGSSAPPGTAYTLVDARRGAGGVKYVSKAQVAAMPKAHENFSGQDGFKLADLLAAVGLNDYASVTIKGATGTKLTISKAQVNDQCVFIENAGITDFYSPSAPGNDPVTVVKNIMVQ